MQIIVKKFHPLSLVFFEIDKVCINRYGSNIFMC